MTTVVPFSSMTSDQLAQVGDLFADPLFGTDPSHYRYELGPDGSVTGRLSVEGGGANKYAKRGCGVEMGTRPEPHPTETQIRQRQELPAMLARLLTEVSHEIQIVI